MRVMANFGLCWNSRFFVTMATGSIWANMPTLNAPYMVQVYYRICLGYVLYSLSSSKLCAEICKFSLPWQQGRSEQIMIVTFKQAAPISPYWVQVYGLYLLRKASYGQFCVKIRDFSLPWHQGRSEQMCLTPFNVPTLNTPNWCRFAGLYVLYNLSYSHFVLKFTNFRYHGNRVRSEQFPIVTFTQAEPQKPLLGMGGATGGCGGYDVPPTFAICTPQGVQRNLRCIHLRGTTGYGSPQKVTQFTFGFSTWKFCFLYSLLSIIEKKPHILDQ